LGCAEDPCGGFDAREEDRECGEYGVDEGGACEFDETDFAAPHPLADCELDDAGEGEEHDAVEQAFSSVGEQADREAEVARVGEDDWGEERLHRKAHATQCHVADRTKENEGDEDHGSEFAQCCGVDSEAYQARKHQARSAQVHAQVGNQRVVYGTADSPPAIAQCHAEIDGRNNRKQLLDHSRLRGLSSLRNRKA